MKTEKMKRRILMWVGKARLEALEYENAGLKNRIKNIEERLNSLSLIHEEVSSYCGGRHFGYMHRHREAYCNTEKIKGVTLAELAKLYIDGTPIIREEKINVSYGK